MLGSVLDPELNQIFLVKMKYVGGSLTIEFVIDSIRRVRFKDKRRNLDPILICKGWDARIQFWHGRVVLVLGESKFCANDCSE